jgi:hypothetical protein
VIQLRNVHQFSDSLVQNVCRRHRPGSGAEDDFPDHGTKTAFELPIRMLTSTRRTWVPLLLVLATVVVWFNASSEPLRQILTANPGGQGVWQKRQELFWPPWRILQLPVTHDSDEHLYYEYSRVLLGKPADLRLVASLHGGDVDQALDRLEKQVRQRTGIHLPYRDLAIEYPPVAVAFILLPGLVADTLPGYRLLWGLLQSLCLLGCFWLGASIDRRVVAVPAAQVLWRALWASLALGSIVVSRFDAFPALLVGLAFVALVDKRVVAAGALLALGTLAKLYPLVLLCTWGGFLLGRSVGSAVRLALGFAGVIAGVSLLAVALYGSDWLLVWQWLGYFRDRPFQIESLPGAIALLRGGISALEYSFGSYNVQTPAWLGPAWTGLTVAAFAALGSGSIWLGSKSAIDDRETTRRLCQLTALALAVILATGKVLSPQYLVWCLPWWVMRAVAPTRRWFLLTVALLLLTQLAYPVLYGLLVSSAAPPVVLLLILRNALLLLFAAGLVRELVQTRTGGLAES